MTVLRAVCAALRQQGHDCSGFFYIPHEPSLEKPDGDAVQDFMNKWNRICSVVSRNAPRTPDQMLHNEDTYTAKSVEVDIVCKAILLAVKMRLLSMLEVLLELETDVDTTLHRQSFTMTCATLSGREELECMSAALRYLSIMGHPLGLACNSLCCAFPRWRMLPLGVACSCSSFSCYDFPVGLANLRFRSCEDIDANDDGTPDGGCHTMPLLRLSTLTGASLYIHVARLHPSLTPAHAFCKRWVSTGSPCINMIMNMSFMNMNTWI